MPDSTISDIVHSIIIIFGIFGLLYMLKDVMMGMTLILVCGFLIFIEAFLNKQHL